MTKQEVIKGLIVCGDDSYQCIGCPYLPERTGNANCANHLCKDAIALLKKQEPITPCIRGEEGFSYNNFTRRYGCGSCGKPIDRGDEFCRHCGKKVKWDD